MDTMYKKRPPADFLSGIGGQLYETKLISLILFRLLHNDSVEDFYLASNMDEIGAFDDVCVRVKIAGIEREIYIFIQAKHKEDDEASLDYEIIKQVISSFVEVRDSFYSSEDEFFNKNFDDVECLFILYTNGKYYDDSNDVESERAGSSAVSMLKQTRREYRNSFSDKLNDLICTGDKTQGTQINYTDKDIELAAGKYLEQEFTMLAKHFVNFLNDEADQSTNIMLDEYILRYHVILAESVVDISEIKSEENEPVQWRDLTLKPCFFDAGDKILKLLRKKICEQVVKTMSTSVVKNQVNNEMKHKDTPKHDTDASGSTSTADKPTVKKLISSFLTNPSALTLAPLIGTHIIKKKGTLKFTAERSNNDIQKLEQIKIPDEILDEAVTIAAKNILLSIKLKVPVTFGNRDLTIGGNDKEVENRLNTLADLVVDLCKKSQLNDSYVVTIDENVGDGFLTPSGGLGGAVGNLLIYDNCTKLFKFTEKPVSLKKYAKTLFEKLNNKINNLHLYRFDAKAIITFPRLALDYTHDAKEILNKVLIYEKQSNHTGVEALLNEEIGNHQKNNGPHNFPVKSDTMIKHYHNEIQKWWMSAKIGTYFVKSKNVYQEAINNIVTEPQLSALQTTFNMNNMKYFGYDFRELATYYLTTLEVLTKAIVVTDISTLTTIKVIQCLKNKYGNNYAVLDLENITNLRILDFSAIKLELKNTEKLLIVLCDSTKINSNQILYKRLYELGQAIEDKKVIIITNYAFLDIVQEYFPCPDVIVDEAQGLISLTSDLQMDLIKNAHVIFQDQEVSFDLIMNGLPNGLIYGAVFDKLIRNETITIGQSLSSPSYEEIKHLYVDRAVSRTVHDDNNLLSGNIDDDKESKAKEYFIRTLYDISDDVVLITATPGMGKSTLLTHLSLETKKLDKKLWIVRVNLLDHSKVFYDWDANKTVIDTLETMKFLCRIILNDSTLSINLTELDDIYLNGCLSDDLVTFELHVFLQFYRMRNLILLFDGFDEICPFYKDTLLKFLKVVINYPRKQKIWVTSRPYSEILPDLKKILGEPYEIQFINDIQQKKYLDKYWTQKIKIETLKNYQINNVTSFIDFMINKQDRKYGRITYIFLDYILSYFPHIVKHSKHLRWTPTVLVPKLTDICNGFVKRQDDVVMGTPLLLNLYASYFVNLMCEGNITKNLKVNLQFSILSVYEMFIESKLQNLYEDKNEMDVYKPDIRNKYEKERADCVAIHKKLGAYTLIFHKICLPELKDLHPFSDSLKEFEDIINEIKAGTEKTGLISHVTADNVPVFLYRTLAEYFTAEYICDIFKSKDIEFSHKNFLYTIALMTFDIFSWINKRQQVDEELDSIIKEIEYKRPSVVSNYGYLFGNGWPIDLLIRLRSSATEDYESDCHNGDYCYDFIKMLRRLETEERDASLLQFQNEVIAKMKPHLKKYFIPFVGENSQSNDNQV